MDTNSMSPADFSAMMGNNEFGGQGAWWIIILFLFFMNGGWGNGYRNNGQLNQYATAASQQEILFNQKFSDLDNKMDRLGNGIADATYALNNTITGQGRTLQNQLAEAKYDTTLGIAQLGAQMDKQTCAISMAIHDQGEKTRAMMQQNTIQNLRDKVASLQADTRFAGVVRYPMSYSYSAGQSPFCNCGCGCGNV